MDSSNYEDWCLAYSYGRLTWDELVAKLGRAIK